MSVEVGHGNMCVVLLMGPESGVLSPTDARALAVRLIEQARYAEQVWERDQDTTGSV